MILTGKIREEFLKWYKDVFSKEHNIHDDGNSINAMPFSMQYGVLVDYFDSVGLYITEDFNQLNGGRGCKIYQKQKDTWKSKRIDGVMLTKCTRQEARTEAIKKANTIRNKQLK